MKNIIILLIILLIILVGWCFWKVTSEIEVQRIKLSKMKAGDTFYTQGYSGWEPVIIDSIKGDTAFYHSSSLKYNFRK